MVSLGAEGALIYKPNAWYNNWVLKRCVAILLVMLVTFLILFIAMYETGDTTVLRMLTKNNEVIVVQVVHRSICRPRRIKRSLCDFIQTCEPGRKFHLMETANKFNFGQVRSDHEVTIGGGSNWLVSLIYSEKPLDGVKNVTFFRRLKSPDV